jgi:4-aminobutyrate aminotransferase
MTAVDVVTESGDYDPKRREAIIQHSFERGLLLLGCGESGVRFCPPLCVTEEQVNTCLTILGAVVADVIPAGAGAR